MVEEGMEKMRRDGGGEKGNGGKGGQAKEVTERAVKQLRRSRNTKYIYHFLRHTRGAFTSGMTGPAPTPARPRSSQASRPQGGVYQPIK